MAERVGFEPTRGLSPLHDFQSCLFSQTPASLHVNCSSIMAERVGFEPTGRVNVQRFSRPPQSATLSPLQAISFLVGQKTL